MAIADAAPQNLATYNQVLKDYYIGPIRDILNSKTVLLNRLVRDQENTSGNIALVPVNLRRNEGLGAIGDGAQLPDPGRQGFDRVEIPMAYDYGRILFTGPTVAASRNSEGAFARVVDTEVRGIGRDLKNEANRMAFGDGSGRLAAITAIAGNIYTVNNPGGFANPGPGVQYFRVGMVVGVYDEVGNTLRGSSNITAVNVATNQITLQNAIGGAAPGEFFYRVSEDSLGVPAPGLPAGSDARFNEPIGLAAMVDDADIPDVGGGTRGYLGIPVATEPVWSAPVIGNGGIPFPLDLDVLQQGEHAADQSGDGKVTIYLVSYGLQRAYLNLLQTDKRYVNTMRLDGGFTALEYNGKPLVPDKDMTWGRIYGLSEDSIKIYQHSPIFWVDDDGHILHRLDDRHSFQATLCWIWQIANEARNSSVRIEDLQDPI